MPILDMPLSDLRQYAGRNPKPTDHDAYWQRALNELREVDALPKLVPADFAVPFAECFDLTFTGVRGARVHAKYLRPKAVKEPHPAVLQFHGYSNHSGDWSDKLGWVGLGYSVAALDCRGQGGSSEDVGGVTGNTHTGHIIRGLQADPDGLLFRHIFLDTVQLAGLVMAFEEVDAARVGAMGSSQGGALSLACAALEPRIKKVASTYPFLSDYQRVWEMDLDKHAYAELRTFFRHYDPTHEREEEWFTKLGYIDVQFLAPRIQADVLMAIGLIDDVCPPSSQFAAFNKIGSRKDAVIYPDFGHEGLPGWNDRVTKHMLDL